jgi:sec-independent protein translocase protein TatA
MHSQTTSIEKETAMPFSVGPMELVIVLVIALVILGPKRLPDAGKALGKGMREFKDSVAGMTGNNDEDEERSSITASASTAAPAPVPAPAHVDAK